MPGFQHDVDAGGFLTGECPASGCGAFTGAVGRKPGRFELATVGALVRLRLASLGESPRSPVVR